MDRKRKRVSVSKRKCKVSNKGKSKVKKEIFRTVNTDKIQITEMEEKKEE